MKILKVALLLLCPLLFSACFSNKAARLDAAEANLNSVEEKVDALLSYTDKTYDVLTDMNLRLETLEQDAKKRGVPIRIKGADIEAVRAELLRAQGKEPAPRSVGAMPNATPNTRATTPQNQLPQQNMANSEAQSAIPKTKPRGDGANSKKADKLAITKGKNKAQELQFPEHTVVSPAVALGSITGQNLANPSMQSQAAQVNKQAQPNVAPKATSFPPVLPPTLPPMIPVAQAPAILQIAPITQAPTVAQIAPVSPVAPSTKSGPPQSYNTAMGLYKNKKYKEAEQAFDSFLSANPDAVLAPNALYWKGETLYARGDYPQAIFAFKEVQTRYPKHSKAPDSLLKTAMSYDKIGDTENADLHYLVLEEDFPTSAAIKRIPR